MTPQQKETLLEALTVLRDLSYEFSQKTIQHARRLCEEAKPILIKIREQGSQTGRDFFRWLASKKHLSKRAITTIALVAVTAGIYQSLPTSSANARPKTEALAQGEQNKQRALVDSQKITGEEIARRLEIARRQAALAAEKARLKQQAAHASLAAEKKKLEASERARKAQLAAQVAEEKARVARLKSTRSESVSSSGRSIFSSRSSSRPVDLGLVAPSRSSSGYHSQSANRDMQRYQQHLSRTMSARGVR